MARRLRSPCLVRSISEEEDSMERRVRLRMGVGYASYAIERLLEMTGQPLRIVSGVLHDECAAFRVSQRA